MKKQAVWLAAVWSALLVGFLARFWWQGHPLLSAPPQTIRSEAPPAPLTEPSETPAPTETPRGTPAPDWASQPINVNTADEDLLCALPGIGPEIAARIVRYREENGPFQRPDDLIQVKGIGEKTVDNLRDYVTCGNDR